MANRMGYITAAGLENLKTHRYQTTGYTYLDTHLFNPFWEGFVKLVPLWVAPNLMTVVGLLCMFLSYGVMAVYDVKFEEQIPLPVLCVAAFLHFAYQTLDACDGKQARRTGSASPLGMLVDHGCDSLSSTIIILTMAQAGALGHESNLRILAIGIWGAFYIATWEEYHTHFCRTQICNFGVTENQILVMFLFVACGVLGIHWFDFTLIDVWGVQIPFRETILYLMSVISYVLIATMVWSCLRATPSKLMALYRLLPFAMLVGALFGFSYCTEIYHRNPAVCIIVCGLYFALVVSRTIISSVAEVSVTQMPLSGLHLESFTFYLFFLNSAVTRNSEVDWVTEQTAFWALFAVVFAAYSTFVLRIVGQLTTALNVDFFTIKAKLA